MAAAAAKLDLTIQYCMPLNRHVLESAKFQVVTQIRASDDYQVCRCKCLANLTFISTLGVTYPLWAARQLTVGPWLHGGADLCGGRRSF